MNNCATIVKLGEIRKHPNADKLMLTTIHGNQVLVGLDAKQNDLGIYFECGLQLSEEFCKANDLIRRKNPETGAPEGGMFDENRRVRAQRLRGEISDGFFIPINSLSFITTDSGKYPMVNQDFNEFLSTPICKKYIPYVKPSRNTGTGQKAKSKKMESVMFLEHFDTEHFGKNIHKITPNSRIIITEKLHGTSQRVGHVQVKTSINWLIKVISLITSWKLPVSACRWQYLNGTRRVVLTSDKKGTGFHEDSLRDNAMAPFVGKLHKGETVYFEVVGFEPSGKSIMPIVNNNKLGKDFVKQYGETTTYSYGCREREAKIFVYRITMTNEDGFSIDYSWQDVKKRCGEIGVSHVPELADLFVGLDVDTLEARERMRETTEKLSIGLSSLDNHIREGVCVRIEGGLNVNVLKHKSFEFKVLEGIVKDAGVVDMEEAQNEEAVA